MALKDLLEQIEGEVDETQEEVEVNTSEENENQYEDGKETDADESDEDTDGTQENDKSDDLEGEAEEGNEEESSQGSDSEIVQGLYSEIEKITGRRIEGDFQDTYEGLANYVNESYKLATQEVVEEIEKNYPEIYNLLDIARNGGDYSNTLAELAKVENEFEQLSEFGEDDIDTQKSIIKFALKEKGLSEKKIERLIENSEDEGELFEDAKAFHDEIKNAKEASKQEKLQQEQNKLKEMNEFISTQWVEVESKIDAGTLGNFMVPKREIKKFKNYISDNVLRDNEGKLFIPHYLDDDSNLAAQFFQYRKGNLSDLIEKKAASQKVINLRAKSEADKKTTVNKQKAAAKNRPSNLSELLSSFK